MISITNSRVGKYSTIIVIMYFARYRYNIVKLFLDPMCHTHEHDLKKTNEQIYKLKKKYSNNEATN